MNEAAQTSSRGAGNAHVDAEMRDVTLGIFSSHPVWIRRRLALILPLTLILASYLTWHFGSSMLRDGIREFVVTVKVDVVGSRTAETEAAVDQAFDELEIGNLGSRLSYAEMKSLIEKHMANAPVKQLDVSFDKKKEQVRKRDLAIMAAVISFLGLGLCLGLTSKLACLQARESGIRGSKAGESVTIPWYIAVGFGLIVFGLPVTAYIHHWLPWSDEIKLDFALLAIFWGMTLFTLISNSSQYPRRNWLGFLAALLWLPPIYMAVAFLSQIPELELLREAIGMPVLPSLPLPDLVSEVIALKAYLFTFLWLFWLKRPKRNISVQKKNNESFLDPAAFVAEILDTATTPHQVVRELHSLDEINYCEPATSPGFWPLMMGGLNPTLDQLAAFEKFRTGVMESVMNTCECPTEADWWNGLNLLFCGPRGSGRTTTLIGCSIYSMVTLGQSVLLVVPGSAKRRWLLERIRRMLRNTGLHLRFNAAELSQTTLFNTSPTLIVATLYELETVFLPALTAARLREDADQVSPPFVRLFGTCAIESLDEFDSLSRAHLVFLIRKLRLLAAMEDRAITVLTAAPPLEDESIEVTGVRFFGERGFRPEKDFIRLRPPRPTVEYSLIELQTEYPAKLAEEIATLLLERDKAALLYRVGVDEEACIELERQLVAKAAAGKIQVIGDLDQPIRGDLAFEGIVYQNLSSNDDSAAICLRMPGASPVIFHIRPDQPYRKVLPDEKALPIFPEPSSPYFVASHALSLWCAAKPGAMLERGWLAQLISPSLLESLPSGQSASSPPIVEVRIETTLGSRRDDDICALSRCNRGAATPIVVTTVPLHPPTLSFQAPGEKPGAFYIFTNALEEMAGATAVRWVSSSGLTLGKSIAVHTPIYLLETADGRFSANHVTQEGDTLKIAARHYIGKGEDFTLPALTVTWKLPDQALWQRVGGGLDFGVTWGRISSPAAVNVTCTIRGLVNESGQISRCEPAEFHFPASLSLVFHSPTDNQEHLWKKILTLTDLTTSHAISGFDAFTTESINLFLGTHLLGAPVFAHFLVFQQYGIKTLWILEPLTTGFSASSTLFDLLARKAFRRDFLKSFHATASDELLPILGIPLMPRYLQASDQ